MSRAFDLTGQVALVTGASRRFVRSIVGALAEAGTDLGLIGRNLQDEEEVDTETARTRRPSATYSSAGACGFRREIQPSWT